MKSIQYKFTPHYNYGGKWTYYKGIWVKGHAFISSGQLLKDEEFAEHLSSILKSGFPTRYLKELNGRFVATGQTDNCPFICTDRTRSFPLFFKNKTGEILISDDPQSLIDENTHIDEKALQEFIASGYTWEDRTLLEDIKQCEPAHLILFHPHKIEKQKFFSFSTSTTKRISFNEAFHQLSDILENIMQRALKVTGDAPVIVPLTSGYDSRFLATWLWQNNVNIHLSFTSGKRNSPEFENAEKVAAKLNLPWKPFYQDDETIKTHFPYNETIRKYIDFSFAFSSMGFFQDVITLNALNFPSETMIFGGHSGDVTAGSHLRPLQQRMLETLQMHYAFHQMFPYFNGSSKAKNGLKQTLKDKYNKCKGDIPFSIIQELDFSERQSKFIVNSCRTYDFFAKGTILPFFDNEFVDFFKDLPFGFRYNKRLYNKVLTEKYFKAPDINFKKEHQPGSSDLYRQLFKQFLPKWLQDIHSKKHPVPDHLNYLTIAKKLKGDAVSFKKAYKFPNQYIIDWYIHNQLPFKMK